MDYNSSDRLSWPIIEGLCPLTVDSVIHSCGRDATLVSASEITPDKRMSIWITDGLLRYSR